MDIYEKCLTLENRNFILRKITKEDCNDLLAVYSDKQALPFFNSDNCHGDNFYYSTRERMMQAIEFWEESYKKGWFVRLVIVDKSIAKAIGTVEVCLRVSKDAFDHMGILRVDVRSDYEKADMLYSIFSLIAPRMNEMLGCKGVITKAPIYAVERIKAIQQLNFVPAEERLKGNNGVSYDGYWKWE